ncbi:MAG: transporter substrate-binding domain-containing protein [Desulfobacterales bacterium]|nr:transporter substrate-binding domain-containing protein [Desulfobacterales bacterium]
MRKRIITMIMAVSLLIGAGSAFGQGLTLATLNWEPFYSENLPEGGFFTALSREAFKRAGYDLKVEFMPWKRALEMAKTGKYDGILGAYHNTDRETYFVFPDAAAHNEEVFFQKKGSGISYKTLDDLKPYKIGGLDASAPMKELKEKGFKTEGLTKELSSIKKLHAGRIDLMIMGKQNLNFALKNMADYKPFQDAFEVLEPPFKSYGLYCPISKKRPDANEIVEKFNAALKEMKADGTYDEILTRFGQK